MSTRICLTEKVGISCFREQESKQRIEIKSDYKGKEVSSGAACKLLLR